MNDSKLYEAYLSIWKNRKGIENTDSSKEQLKKAILIELRDENSHPRIRKSIEKKFYYAIKRISESTLDNSFKMELIKYYLETMEEISH
ncbi:hypothetical protein ACQKP0_06625 [Heyndrickxia sp. NPDC080065]|uniref:hypothetical protein n=1 Tax=Heyndrickxia sp. NPDC080065 TaxID=3390568 RepID=UPI003D02CF17